MKKDLVKSSDSLQAVVKVSGSHKPKRRISLNENDPVDPSFEQRIATFHTKAIAVFLTLLLVYDLGRVLLEKFLPIFSYLMTVLNNS
jgi:hypothetical protein